MSSRFINPNNAATVMNQRATLGNSVNPGIGLFVIHVVLYYAYLILDFQLIKDFAFRNGYLYMFTLVGVSMLLGVCIYIKEVLKANRSNEVSLTRTHNYTIVAFLFAAFVLSVWGSVRDFRDCPSSGFSRLAVLGWSVVWVVGTFASLVTSISLTQTIESYQEAWARATPTYVPAEQARDFVPGNVEPPIQVIGHSY